jgi:hypothetical protein
MPETVHYLFVTHNYRTPAGRDRWIWKGQEVRRLDRLVIGLIVLAAVLFAVGLVAALTSKGGGDTTAGAPGPERADLAGHALTIAWVGDTMLGSASDAVPDDGAPLFADVRSLLRHADITAGNLEGVLTEATSSKCDGDEKREDCFAFRGPPAGAQTLRRAGFDVMNLANNHAWDYGATGQADTIAALDTADVGWTGTPGQVTVLERHGVRVAFVGYAPYSWAPSMHDVPLAQGLVRYAQTKGDVVVAFMHAGAEGRDATHTPVGVEISYGEDRGDTRAFAHALVDAGADLVLGSGPHVIRGVERYRDRLIAYSLGNFAGWHNFASGGTYDLSALLKVRINGAGEVLGGRWRSLRLREPGIPQPDPSNESASLAVDLSHEDFGAAAYPMQRRGTLGSSSDTPR